MDSSTEDHQEHSIGIDGHINIGEIDDKANQNSSVAVPGTGRGEIEEKDMAPLGGNSIHRSSSRPQLDLSKAAIQGNFEEKDPTILLPNQSDDISHLALDIGGKS